jgi:hypothetical protein
MVSHRRRAIKHGPDRIMTMDCINNAKVERFFIKTQFAAATANIARYKATLEAGVHEGAKLTADDRNFLERSIAGQHKRLAGLRALYTSPDHMLG